MAETRSLTRDQVAEVGRCQALLPKESDFKGRKGYSRKYRADGTYEWKYSYTTNVGGKLTNEAHEVLERMRPFAKADTERHSRTELRKPKARLRDRYGQVRLVDPGLADAAAHRNGWTHAWRARGNPVESGVGGMLWRAGPRGWEPLGVRCLGAPLRGSARVPRGAIQHDPSGNPWAWIAGAWRRA
jgi:hypothetical protein